MKTTISKLMIFAFLVIVGGLISCEGDEGPMGPEGPQGPQGPVGPQGSPGSDGADGADGADGNANVSIITLAAADFTWTAGTYLGRTSNVFTLTNEAVNEDIINHGAVLGYFNLFGNAWYPLPFIWENATGSNRQYIIYTYTLNTINLYAYQTTGVLNPGATEYRFLLITDNTVPTKSSGGKDIISKLEQAGVNVANYHEVMDHFGLQY